MVYECDNCGRELDDLDAEAGSCVCGAPIPRLDEIRDELMGNDDG